MPNIYCIKCGNAVRPEDRFCRKCGTSIGSKTVKTQPIPFSLPGKGLLTYNRLWILPVAVILLVLTFPLWNPQKLYIRGLIRDLGDETTSARAFGILTRDIGAPAVVPLIDALGEKNPRIQAAAKDALIIIGTPAIEPLIDRYADDQNYYSISGDVLAEMGAPAVKPLIAAIEGVGYDTNKIIQLEVVVERIGMPAVEPSIDAAKDGSVYTRLKVISILFNGYCTTGVIGEGPILVCAPPSGDIRTLATGFLIDMLGDPEEIVRSSAVESLAQLDWMKEERAPLLIAALRDPSPPVREKAANAFHWVRDEQAIPGLVELLKDEALEVRKEAALALAHQGIPGAKALVAAFDEEELAITVSDYHRIITEGDEASVPVLIAALFSPDGSSMAGDYLNCGQYMLENAAEEWAEMNGFTITYFNNGSGSGLTWGGH